MQTHSDGRTKEMYCYEYILMDWIEDKKIFQCCPWGYPMHPSRVLYLHQLQQLIRLFFNKEIEVKWEK